ncbi:MAG: glycosyltransferase family 9 protein [Bacteroidota bacterium]
MHDPSRILVVRTDRLGDVVLTLPLLPILRNRFPDAYIAMLVSSYAGGIVEGHPALNEHLTYDKEGARIPMGAMVSRLREGRFDTAVVVHPTARLALLIWLARIPVRIGSGYRWYSVLFNRRVYTHRKTAERHELEYNLELLDRLGCTTRGVPPQFTIPVPAEAHRRVNELLAGHGIEEKARLAVVHPGSGGSAREWPLESFGGLARILIDVHGMEVIVTGSPNESEQARSVVAATQERAHNLAGMLGLKELASLLGRSSLLVGNSTGPLHMAVAMGTPVLGFYPQIPVMGPRRWGPYTERARVLVPDRPVDCSECKSVRGRSCSCMASITVDAAAAAVAELLSTVVPHPALHGT